MDKIQVVKRPEEMQELLNIGKSLFEQGYRLIEFHVARPVFRSMMRGKGRFSKPERMKDILYAEFAKEN